MTLLLQRVSLIFSLMHFKMDFGNDMGKNLNLSGKLQLLLAGNFQHSSLVSETHFVNTGHAESVFLIDLLVH